MIWRTTLIFLLAANLLVAVLFAFSEPPVDNQPREIAPLDPSLPTLELVTELSNQVNANGLERCYTIGPLATEMMLENAQDRLRPFALDIRARQTTADLDRGWRVFLPAESRSQAVGLSRQLNDRGVEDFFIVTSGEHENTISVGLFESLENARGRQASLQMLGFDAQLQVRRETVSHYWVDYRIEADERSPWRFIVRASPGSTQREIPCF
jgi:hypothetical protein